MFSFYEFRVICFHWLCECHVFISLWRSYVCMASTRPMKAKQLRINKETFMHYPMPPNLTKLKQNSETCHIYQVFLTPSLFHNAVGFNPYFQFIYLHTYVRRRG